MTHPTTTETQLSHPPFDHLELRNLFHIGDHPESVSWQPFRPGVEIHRLYGDGLSGPNAALIRFLEDSKISLHVHEGYEHILVLAGRQTDANGTIEPGTLRVHPPGTKHSVIGEAGCIVLAIYEKSVRFE
jgi:anti-sigma factor ChrR (cupin superfamily)